MSIELSIERGKAKVLASGIASPFFQHRYGPEYKLPSTNAVLLF